MKRLLSTVAIGSLLAACANTPPTHPTPQAAPSSPPGPGTVVQQPESASGFTPKPGWATAKFAVAAANPVATEAGYQTLKAGGSAVDGSLMDAEPPPVPAATVPGPAGDPAAALPERAPAADAASALDDLPRGDAPPAAPAAAPEAPAAAATPAPAAP